MKTSFYDKISYISKEGYLPFVINFSKVTIFSVTFECLLSVYILEIFAIMTKFFLVDPTSIPKLFVIILFPLILEIVICSIFGISVSIFFANTVYKFSVNIKNKKKGFVDCKGVMEQYKKKVVMGQVIGTSFYIITTLIIPIILINVYPDVFINPIGLVIWIPIIGAILGIVWNITSYYRNQRIMWHKILPQFSKSKEIVLKKNYNYLIKNAVWNIISIAILFILSIIVLFNLHPKILSEDVFGKLVSEYNFLFVAFGGLIAVYIKGVIKTIYSTKENKEEIFPSLRQLFNANNKN